MRITNTRIYYIIIFCIIFCNCGGYKSIDSIGNFYKGEIKILNNEEKINLKFKLNFDSLDNISIKVYNTTGFKIGNFTISKDSILITNLYDLSYKVRIINIYNKISNEIFLDKLIIKIFKNEIFQKNIDISKSLNCKPENNSINSEENEVIIFSRNCKKMLIILEKKIVSLKKRKKFEILISKDSKIELTFIKI